MTKLNEIIAIENQKISDSLFINLGFDLDEMMRSAKHHNIDTKNPDIKKFCVEAIETSKMNLAETMFQKYKPSDDLMKAMIEEGLVLGQPVYEEEGLLNFEYFHTTQKIIAKYVSLSMKDGLTANITKRREHLKNNEMREHGKLVRNITDWKKQTKSAIMLALYCALKVPHDTYLNTLKRYSANFETKLMIQKSMRDEEDLVMNVEKKELTRDQALDAVMFIENAKLTQFKKAFTAVGEGRNPLLILEGLKVSKVIIEDCVYNKWAFETSHVFKAVEDQKLKEDAEFKGILNDIRIQKLTFLRDADPTHLRKVARMQGLAMKHFGVIDDDEDYETEDEEEVVDGGNDQGQAAGLAGAADGDDKGGDDESAVRDGAEALD